MLASFFCKEAGIKGPGKPGSSKSSNKGRGFVMFSYSVVKQATDSTTLTHTTEISNAWFIVILSSAEWDKIWSLLVAQICNFFWVKVRNPNFLFEKDIMYIFKPFLAAVKDIFLAAEKLKNLKYWKYWQFVKYQHISEQYMFGCW